MCVCTYPSQCGSKTKLTVCKWLASKHSISKVRKPLIVVAHDCVCKHVYQCVYILGNLPLVCVLTLEVDVIALSVLSAGMAVSGAWSQGRIEPLKAARGNATT